MRTALCITAAALALVACGASESDRTTVPMTSETSNSVTPVIPTAIPSAEEPENEFQPVDNTRFILNDVHIFDFNTGGDIDGYCVVLADTFNCSGTVPEPIVDAEPTQQIPRLGEAPNEVQVTPEGISYITNGRPETPVKPEYLQPGEYTDIGAIRCTMLDPHKLICSGPGGTISVNGENQIINIERGN